MSRSRPRVERSLRATSSRAVVSSCSESSWETASSIRFESTPLVRSSRARARLARPRPWCRDSTQASAKALSLIRPTSSNRDSTSSATSSGISRLRRASASCLRVRGVPVSRRRQIARARSAGSPEDSPFSALDEKDEPPSCGPPPSGPSPASPNPRRRPLRPPRLAGASPAAPREAPPPRRRLPTAEPSEREPSSRRTTSPSSYGRNTSSSCPSAPNPPVPPPVPPRPRLSGALGYAYSAQSVLRVTD